MKLVSLIFLLAAGLFAASSSSTTSSSSSGLASFDAQIMQLVSEKQPQARLGLSIRSIKKDSLLYSIGGTDWFTPASTMKILTVAAAMDTIPLDWTPSTKLSLLGKVKGQKFQGIVLVKGGGDPNLSARYYSDALEIPMQMVDSIRSLGIDTIQGSFEADESWFQGPRRPKVWRGYFFDTWYGTEISALSFNDNVYQFSVLPGMKAGDPVRVALRPDVGYVKVINTAVTNKGRKASLRAVLDSTENVITLSGSLGLGADGFKAVYPVRKPAGYFLAALRKAFALKKLVFIPDSNMVVADEMASFRFGEIPVQSIYDEVNQRSQNFHAECLLRNLGAIRLNNPSAEGGVMAGKLFLRKMNIPESDFVQVDGSGLSPDNKVKPDAASLLLARMARHKRGALYINSFGQPGVTGSGVRRLNSLGMSHLIRFKTGFIAGAQGLVGYIGTVAGDTLAVTLYLNGYKGADQDARNLMDTIWARIANGYNQEYASLMEAKKIWLDGDSVHGVHARLNYFSKALMGRPYFLGPTGEGFGAKEEPKPLMDLSRFDCVTYIEHVMALAYAPSVDSIFPILQRIRYKNGSIGFANRKHYFVEDWIGQGKEWVQLMRVPGDTVVRREMDKKTFFANKQIVWDAPNPVTQIPNLPIDQAFSFAKVWNGPDQIMGVAFMTTLPNLCVFHTGFLIAEKGKPLRFRHASQLKGMTTEQDLADYLQAKKARIPGLVFFEFKGD